MNLLIDDLLIKLRQLRNTLIHLRANVSTNGHKYLNRIIDNKTFLSACAYGHIDVVEILLKDSNIDPTYKNNKGLKHVSKNGHLNVVKLLLQDPRINLNRNDFVLIQLPNSIHNINKISKRKRYSSKKYLNYNFPYLSLYFFEIQLLLRNVHNLLYPDFASYSIN